MGNFLIAGLLVGTIMWWGKYFLTSIILPKGLKKWLHNSPIGLISLDILMTYLALHIINAAGANGLVTLFILVAYGMWTTIFIIKYIIIKKSKQLWSII